MTEAKFTNFKYTDEFTLNFDVFGYDCSFVNAIRRTILSKVPTLGFRTYYGKESDIKIIKNTSPLHNEFLAHRLSMIPIHFDYNKINDFESKNFEFLIKKKNNTNKIIHVTSKDIEIRDTSKENTTILSDKIRDTFFPKDSITGDYILINKLKPSKSGLDDEGEELDIVMKATLGIGEEHSQFCPTCVSVFINIRDEAKCEIDFKQLIEKKNIERKGIPLSNDEIIAEKKIFNIMDADRCYQTDERGEPNAFHFTIESDGRIPSHLILLKSLEILKKTLYKFIDEIKNEDIIDIVKSNCIMNAYDIILEDKDYTLGYLLQYYVFKLYQNVDTPVIKYIASDIPHPLENKLLIRIGFVDDNTVITSIRKLLSNTCQYINQEISKLFIQIKTHKF